MGLLRKIISGSLSIAATNVMSTLLGLMATYITVRSISLGEFGLFNLLLSIIALLSILLDPGFDTAVTAQISKSLKGSEHRRVWALIKSYAAFDFSAGILLSFMLFATTPLLAPFIGWLFSSYTDLVISLLQVSSAIFFLTSIRNFYQLVFLSHSKFGYLSAMQVIEALAKLALTVYLLVFLGMGVYGAVYTLIGSAAVMSLAMLPFVLATLKAARRLGQQSQSRTGEPVITIENASYLLPSAVLKPLIGNIPIWIVQLVSGIDSVAIYSAALKLYSFFVTLIGSIETVLVPVISGESAVSYGRVAEVSWKGTKYTLIFSLFLLASLVLSSPLIVPLIFGNAYATSSVVLAILAFALIPRSLSISHVPQMFAYGALSLVRLSFSIEIVILLALGASLTLFFGVNGMAAAFVLDSFLLWAVRQHLLSNLNRQFAFKLEHLCSIDEKDIYIMRRLKDKISYAIKQII